MMQGKKPLRSREERTHNLVSIEPYDNTSHAYRKEQPKRTETGFGFYLSIAIITFMTILFPLRFGRRDLGQVQVIHSDDMPPCPLRAKASSTT